jgi:multidrug resistance efflux pump
LFQAIISLREATEQGADGAGGQRALHQMAAKQAAVSAEEAKQAQAEAEQAEAHRQRAAAEAARLHDEWKKAEELAYTETVLRNVAEQMHVGIHNAEEEHKTAQQAHKAKIEQLRLERKQKREMVRTLSQEGPKMPTFGKFNPYPQQQ